MHELALNFSTLINVQICFLFSCNLILLLNHPGSGCEDSFFSTSSYVSGSTKTKIKKNKIIVSWVLNIHVICFADHYKYFLNRNIFVSWFVTLPSRSICPLQLRGSAHWMQEPLERWWNVLTDKHMCVNETLF